MYTHGNEPSVVAAKPIAEVEEQEAETPSSHTRGTSLLQE